ncbi:cell division protein ZapD [Candidatus Berkiella cookevillensis]|uniref:Cell division protein ZapD n=1 Tax=Candidatus Berkiella cookevillensis TaxID=437022 RepID=A0A0Q9YMH4_9GAMM|nr:cell division protein ZapD [Candidatus Berkiella cookevillensis]MCS5709187.1 cell division protein ZapD [Candidatus Berkiella cookevillensis]
MDDTSILNYEFPISERYRIMLRLEHLFQFSRDRINLNHPADFELFLQTLIEISELFKRTAYQSELLDEIQKYHNYLLGLMEIPSVDKIALDSILTNIESSSKSLKKFNIDAIQFFKHEIVKDFRKRDALSLHHPCFDMPLLHYWSNHNHALTRQTMLTEWIEEFAPIEDTLLLLLHLVRQSAYPKSEITTQGKFLLNLSNASTSPLIKISYDANLKVYPEISGSKHRVYLRFMPVDTNVDCDIFKQEIPFELTVYHLS